MKACKLCGRTDVKFSKCKGRKDGLDARCNDCRHQIYLNNKEHIIKKVQENYQKNKDKIRLREKTRRQKNKDSINEARRLFRSENKEHCNEIRKNWYQKRKQKCFSFLGGVCKKCGISDTNLLNIDHINNNGKEERKTINSGVSLWSKILKMDNPFTDYQLLCFNCNIEKYINKHVTRLFIGENKICPTCKQEKDLSLFNGDVRNRDGVYYECSECFINRYRDIKLKAMIKLGSSCCIKCGESNLDKLSVDHIFEDGGGANRNDKSRIIYSKIMKDQIDVSKLQVLCFNCNYEKYIFSAKSEKSTKIEKLILKEKPNEILGPDVNFSFSDIKIDIGTRSECLEFLEKFHYAGFGRGHTQLYSIRLNNELIAVCKFCPPVRVGVATSLKLDFNNVLELDRFCIHPSYHKKNFSSWILSRVTKLLKKSHNSITHLVSFADLEQGHTGIIYKSANWKCLGKTSRSYYYLDGNGNKLHKKTVYNAAVSRFMKESEYALANNYVKKYVTYKMKYMYQLR